MLIDIVHLLTMVQIPVCYKYRRIQTGMLNAMLTGSR
jgi:hypothetical protein